MGYEKCFPLDFALKVSIQGPDDCWEWKYGKTRSGYGQAYVQGKPYRAHRYAYIIAKGPIPAGMVVRHTCDNPGCVNPSHLLLGTDADNYKDSIERGRRKYGEWAAGAKLTDEQVEELREAYSAGGITQKELGLLYGIAQSYVNSLVRHKQRKL